MAAELHKSPNWHLILAHFQNSCGKSLHHSFIHQCCTIEIHTLGLGKDEVLKERSEGKATVRVVVGGEAN